VVGAGVIGSAVTFELARSGRSVVCVDAGPGVGAGSTSSSSAIIRFHYSTLDSVLTAWEAAEMWHNLAHHLGVVDPDGMARFVPTGCLVLDYPGTTRHTVLAHFDDVGIPYETLEAAAIRRRFPDLDVGDYSPPTPVEGPEFTADPHGELGGYYEPDAGFIDDPMRAAGNFMYAARCHGATLVLNQEVTEVRRDGDRVAGVALASGQVIEAPVVVNVAGPAASRLNRLAGVTGDMRIGHRPLRQEVHVAQAPPGFGLDSGSMVADLGTGIYLRPHLGATLLVGGTEPACDGLEWVDDPAEYNTRPTVVGFQRNLWRAARRLPTLPIPHRPVGLAALYDASDDWMPIYDKSSLDGYFMACATSGNQFKNAPMAGRFVAALVEAADRGVDHDLQPVSIVGPRTGRTIDLAAFSRRRQPALTSGTVMG
jgi:sarcosine oxidase subunit beta